MTPVTVPRVDLEALSTADQEILAEILDRFLTQLEQGQAPDVDSLLEQHPQLAAPLRGYLDSLQLLHRATQRPVPEGAVAGRPATEGPVEATPPLRELGDYRLLREIGRGGMGVVYEAWQLSLDRRVALKMLPFASVLDPKHVARFQNEVRAAAQLLHPHIVPVFGVGCERGVHYYSMQFIDGQPLDEAIRELRRLPGAAVPTAEGRGRSSRPGSTISLDRPGEGSRATRPAEPSDGRRSAVETRASYGLSTVRSVRSGQYIRSVAALMAQAADALQHAHEFGVIHRDIKPSNLLVDRQGQLWVTDFGLARIASDVELTATGDLVGTARYMSPEQAAGKPALVDHRSDVYALGVTMYELLTLRPAFPGSDRAALLRQIEHDTPPAARRMNPAVPVDLETILLRAMRKDREQRYQSAGELADDLRRFLDGRSPLAHRPTWWERAWSFANRHRRAFMGGLAASILGLLLCAAGLFAVSREQRATAAALRRSESHLAVAKRVVDRFGAQATEDLAEIAGAEEIRGAMLLDALQFYEELREQSRTDPLLQGEAATAAFKAAALRESLGQFASAESLYEQARQLFEAGSHRDPSRVLDVALCDHNLALLRWKQGDLSTAETLLRRAADLQGTTGREMSADWERRRRREYGATQGNLAGVQLARGRLDAALTLLRATAADQRRWLKEDEHPVLRRQFAANCRTLAAQDSVGSGLAKTWLREAIDQLQQLVEHAAVPRSADRADLAMCRGLLAELDFRESKDAAANEAFRESIAELRRIVAEHPRSDRFQADLATLIGNWGACLLDQHLTSESETAFREAQQILNLLCDKHPDQPEYRSQLATTFHNLGWLTEQQQRWAEAARMYSKAAENQQAAVDAAPESAEFRQLLEQHQRGRDRVQEGRRATARETEPTPLAGG